MKRKKINIGAISTTLNRSEMREIMAGSGGSGGGGGSGSCTSTCTSIAQACAAAVCYGSCGSMAVCNQQLDCCTSQCYGLSC